MNIWILLLNSALRGRNAQRELGSEESEMVLVLLAQLDSSQIRSKTDVLMFRKTLLLVSRRNAVTKLLLDQLLI
jgi:hypothetical protein